MTEAEILRMYFKSNGIAAQEAAINAGLKLKQANGKYCADCIKPDCAGEGTIFFNGNNYKCTKCGDSGNSVDLYANVYGITNREAIVRLMDDFPETKPAPMPEAKPDTKAAPQPAKSEDHAYSGQRQENITKWTQQRDAAREAAQRMKDEGIYSREQIKQMIDIANDAETRIEMCSIFQQDEINARSDAAAFDSMAAAAEKAYIERYRSYEA